jgi:thiol-disulfide isomerase/thioredoxin
VPAALIVTLVAGCAAGVSKWRAPDFRLTRLNGKGKVSFSQFKGKPVLLNFWASWCPPCRVEMPGLSEVHEKYRKKGVEFLLIATSDTRKDAEAFLRSNKISIPAVIDEHGDSVLRKYRGRELPATYFIDRQGMVVAWAIGFLTEGQVAEQLDSLLAPGKGS